MYPSIGANTLGTIAAGTVAAAWTVVNTKCDYSRNLLFTVTGPAGGVGGTCTVNGTNQFGVSISETITIGSANGGGTAAGTKVFDTIANGTYSPNGVNNNSTTVLGYAKGTASGIACLLGLPVKIAAVGDVKRITWIANGTQTDLTGGTISTYVSTTNHTFMGSSILAATDIYVVDVLSSYNSANDTNVA